MSHNPWNKPADGRLDLLTLVNWDPAFDNSNPLQLTTDCVNVVMHSDQSLAIREDRSGGDATVAVTVTGNTDNTVKCTGKYRHASACAAMFIS